jgi:MinD-like ATPase involved in chromosome partitioning or flagellar assembly
MGQNDSGANDATFPKLTPRTFAEEDDEVPVMEQLPAPQTYGPPASFSAWEQRSAADSQPVARQPAAAQPVTQAPASQPPAPPPGGLLMPGVYGSRTPGAAPPLPPQPAAGQSVAAQSPATQRSAPPLMTPPLMTPPPTASPLMVPPLAAPTFPAPPPAAPTGISHGGAGWAMGPESFGGDDEDLGLEAGVVAESSDVLTAEWLIHGRRVQPGPGWRRTVYRASGGLIRVGESAANLRRRDLINRARTPVAGGHHRVAVMSLKGGVGKTTTAVGLGATLASLRGDRVIAMDANPDRGTLSDKVRLETGATIRDLLNHRAGIRRYADVRQFTSQATSRLEILASDRDPGVSIEFNADDYREVSWVLEHFYSIAITDCGTGLLHSAMSGILELSDHIVLVSSPSVDGARSASATLDWLEAHQYSDLVRSAVVVLSTIRPRSRSTVDIDRLEAHFAARCRDVVRVPYDSHLDEGAEVELDLLSSATRDAYLALAATVADGFAVPRRSRAYGVASPVQAATPLP